MAECPNCGGEMAQGFIYDRGDSGVKWQQVGIEGPVEKSWRTGIKTEDRNAFYVTRFAAPFVAAWNYTQRIRSTPGAFFHNYFKIVEIDNGSSKEN